MYKIQLNEDELNLLMEDYPLYKIITPDVAKEIDNKRIEWLRLGKHNHNARIALKNKVADWIENIVRSHFDGKSIPENVSKFLDKINAYNKEGGENKIGKFWDEMLAVSFNSSGVKTGHGSVASRMRYNTHPDDAMNRAIGGSDGNHRGLGANANSSWANKNAKYSIGEKPSEEFGSRKHSAGIHDYEPIDADYIGKLSDEEYAKWIHAEENKSKAYGVDQPFINIPIEDKIGNKMAKEMMLYYKSKFNNDTKKAIQVIRLMYNNGKKNNEFKQFNGAYKKYIGNLPLYSGDEYSSEYNHTISNEGVNYMLSKDIFNSLINEADDIEVNIDADDVGELAVDDDMVPATGHVVGEDDSSYFVQLVNDIMMSDDRYSMNTLQTVWEKKGILAIEHIYSKVVGDLPNKEQVQSPEADQPELEQEPEIQDDELSRLVKLSR